MVDFSVYRSREIMQLERFSDPLIARLLILLFVACATAVPAVAETADTPADSADVDEIRNLLDLGLSGRDAWYVRGFDSFFARDDPGEGDAARGEPVRIDKAFLPYAGLRIRRIWILGRQAFGTVVADTNVGTDADPDEVVETRTGPFARALNAIATVTRPSITRNYLRFDEGDLIDPFALADSERMLRQQGYVSDAKIEVVPLDDEPGWADVAVLVRDRFPLGAKAKIHTRDRYNIEVFHRNVAGVGLNLEYEAPVENGKTPTVGHRFRASFNNLAGSFVDLFAQTRREWSLEETFLAFNRDFVHPDIRLLGGLGLNWTVDKNQTLLPPGIDLESITVDPWLGWGIRFRDADEFGRRRLRLIPALRVRRVNYLQPPRQFAETENQWRDHTRFLAQCSLVGVDYFTTSLVYGYGETEDIPSGIWAGLVAGFETTERRDRLYHGIRAYWPRFSRRQSLMLITASFGGYRSNGRLEDGVLDLGVGGFGPLQRRSYGHWRLFYAVNYTLGINRGGNAALRLDELGLRDLDSDLVAGQQRLSGGFESVLFTRYAILGFKIAAFGYVAGGLVGDSRTPIFDERFSLNVGLGARLNNPRLVIPTTELRVGLLSTPAGVEPAFTVRMGDVGFLRRSVPSVVPEIIPFR